MRFPDIAQTLLRLQKADLDLREQLLKSGQLHQGYHPDMAALHQKNAEQLDAIINTIGYPTVAKVGSEASEAAWLIIQHAIGQPAFMKRCARLLEASGEGELQLAYLTDRIAVFEDRPQHYGTQFDWDENGLLSPKPYDDLAKVNQRRKALGLNSLEEQIAIMRKQALEEGQLPPADMEKRKREYDAWRKRVGWTK